MTEMLMNDAQSGTKDKDGASGQDSYERALDLKAEGKLHEAMALFEQSALEGNADSAFVLGSIYYEGQGAIEIDHDLSYQWFSQGAALGCLECRYVVAMMEEDALLTPKDQQKILQVYLDLAREGHKEAQLKVAIAIKEGLLEGTQEDAMEWCRRAARQDCPEAQLRLGLNYCKQGNYFEARKWFLAADENGYSRAACDLGLIYFFAEGVARDLDKAIDWFEKGAKADEPYSLFYLGKALLEKESSKTIEKVVLSLWERASDLGCTKAKEALEALCQTQSFKEGKKALLKDSFDLREKTLKGQGAQGDEPRHYDC